jgi:hypothetical protein
MVTTPGKKINRDKHTAYSASKGIGHNQRRGGKVIGPNQCMNSPFEVPVTREYCSSNDI